MSESKNGILRLHHIKDACAKIAQFLDGYDFEKFSRDPKTQDAVAHQIQIIGEAARNLEPKIRENVKDVLLEDVIGMRNKIVHDYFEIELSIVWDAATIDVPDLLSKVQKVLSQ